MIRPVVAALACLAALSGCSVIFPEDPRLGAEGESACITRVEEALLIEFAGIDSEQDTIWVPTFTYDITKLGLDEIQALSQSSSDEVVGTDLVRSTNETSTAVDAFMAQPVDEGGSFLLGRDPALYRVRGAPVRFDEAIAGGCARQQSNMRLIDVDLAPVGPSNTEIEPEQTADSENENIS